MATAEETAHAAVVLMRWALANEASRRRHFKVSGDTLVACTVKTPPALAVIMAEEKRLQDAAAAAAAEIQMRLHPHIGQEIPGQGIFLGKYEPKDRNGNSLGKNFNVFAAKQDLTDAAEQTTAFTYDEAVKCISELKGWNGFDGTHYANDSELYQSMKDDTYKGGWIIPTRALLTGADGDQMQLDNIYAHKDQGAFKDTFTAAGSPDNWYWSCTEGSNRSLVWSFDFLRHLEDPYLKHTRQLHCRPVRLVAIEGG